MKPTRQMKSKFARIKTSRIYLRKPDPAKDPLWLVQVLKTVDFLREQELRRRTNERQLYTSKVTSRLRSIGPQGSSNSSSPQGGVAADRRNSRKQAFPWVEGMPGEKRHGGMHDETISLKGPRVTVTVGTGQNPDDPSGPPITGSTTTVAFVQSFVKDLSFVESVNGNHKTPNPHRFQLRRTNYGQGVLYSGDSLNSVTISGTEAVGFGLTGSFHDQSTFVRNKTLSQLYENVRGDVDLSVDAFQAKQTGQMISPRFKQARELFLKKAPFALVEMVKIVTKMSRSNPKTWGSLWLEWTYGWKPLAGSIYGAADQMVKVATSPGTKSLPVRAQSSEMGDKNLEESVDGFGVLRTKYTESVFRNRMRCHFSMVNSRLNAVAGLTSLNPVSIAWELVPYSFVADWFVNVGGYLRNMESSLLYSSDFTGGFETVQKKFRVLESAQGGSEHYSVSGKGDSEVRAFQRNPFGSSPMPSPPTFNPKLGTSRLISAASLLSQQLHSFKR